MMIEGLGFEERSAGQDFSLDSATKNRSKTSLRLRYEAEIAVLKRDLGSLEDVRIKLGFSRRKICQVLMVDPSAWTRWTGKGGDAPPHIYQALRWYLDSKGHQVQKLEGYWEQLNAENRKLHDDLLELQGQLRKLKSTFYIAFLAGGSIGLIYFLSRFLHL